MPGLLARALRRLNRTLDQAGIPHAFMGGIAVNVWIGPRATLDIDCLAEIPEAQRRRVRRRLQAAGFSFWSPPAAGRIVLPIWSLWTGRKSERIYVDLFLAQQAYQNKALERRIRVPFSRIKIPVLSAEDLLLHKLLSDRTMDRADVEGLLEAAGPKLDWRYLRRWSRELGVRLPKWPRHHPTALAGDDGLARRQADSGN